MTDIVLIRGQRHDVLECISCGVVYTCPERVIEHQRKVGGYHTCPNGHSQGWTKDESEEARTRRERDRLKQENARLEQEAREAFDRAIKAEAREKKLRKRASAGTCPCCNRTFSNMAVHMKKLHPEFKAEPPKLKVVA